MNITIIGSGNVGTALAYGFNNAGHNITFAVRNSESPKTKKALDTITGSQAKSIADACTNADVILITTPPDAVLEIIPQLGSINNKVVIDATNSIRTKPGNYSTVYEAVKKTTGTQQIVKCFNSTGFENMLNPVYSNVGVDMFMAGDNPKAKEIAKKLSLEIGFENCYDFGGDDKVSLLEQLALSWINLAIMQNNGRTMAFKIVKR